MVFMVIFGSLHYFFCHTRGSNSETGVAYAVYQIYIAMPVFIALKIFLPDNDESHASALYSALLNGFRLSLLRHIFKQQEGKTDIIKVTLVYLWAEFAGFMFAHFFWFSEVITYFFTHWSFSFFVRDTFIIGLNVAALLGTHISLMF